MLETMKSSSTAVPMTKSPPFLRSFSGKPPILKSSSWPLLTVKSASGTEFILEPSDVLL